LLYYSFVTSVGVSPAKFIVNDFDWGQHFRGEKSVSSEMESLHSTYNGALGKQAILLLYKNTWLCFVDKQAL